MHSLSYRRTTLTDDLGSGLVAKVPSYLLHAERKSCGVLVRYALLFVVGDLPSQNSLTASPSGSEQRIATFPATWGRTECYNSTNK